jgi:FkbM family methyltransferase
VVVSTAVIRRPISRRKKFRLAKKLARAGDPVGALRWLVASLRDSWAPMTVRIRGHRIRLRASSNDLSIALQSLCGEYDELFERVPALQHGLIIDAGGYIGTAAIAFAEAYPDADVVTIEPSPDNFALLIANVAPYPRIHALNRALGSRAGAVELKDRGIGFAGLTVVVQADDRETVAIGSIERTTIPAILAEQKRRGADIVKIDIEGGELDLLSGDISWIGNARAVCIELHDRIAAGCSDAWSKATAGRDNGKLGGEKYLSLVA